MYILSAWNLHCRNEGNMRNIYYYILNFYENQMINISVKDFKNRNWTESCKPSCQHYSVDMETMHVRSFLVFFIFRIFL